MPSVLFASQFCYLDYASGAALSLRELFSYLVPNGWRCKVFCGDKLDQNQTTIQDVFSRRQLTPQTWSDPAQPPRFLLHRVVDGNIPVTVYEPPGWNQPPAVSQGYPYIQLLDRLLESDRPDLLLTWGGGWMGRAIKAAARRHGIPLVFWLRNEMYLRKDLFSIVAAAITPSQFMADYYHEKLGLNCDGITSPIRPERVIAEKRRPRFVTFVAPIPEKGVFYFARIASELARLRPDIEVLVVIGRGDEAWLDRTGLTLRGLPNLTVMPQTTDPREFWSVTRALLAPSLWTEAFMRTAAEAMLNGIPVLASRRAALPSTLGNSGFLFDIPPLYTPDSRQVPTVGEVKPWIDTLVRLWDDPAFYQEQSARCLAESRRFLPETVIPRHEAVLHRAIGLVQPPPAQPAPLADDIAILPRVAVQRIQLSDFPDPSLDAVGFICA
jgi:glycosyltransferase involved in cell wall biosynthesis